jgi:hypothetical protein
MAVPFPTQGNIRERAGVSQEEESIKIVAGCLLLVLRD